MPTLESMIANTKKSRFSHVPLVHTRGRSRRSSAHWPDPRRVYLVENGEIVGAVNNFRFNESPVDLLAKTTEVGRTARALSREWNEYFNRTAMPALAVEGFNMSSVSPAT